MPKHEPTLIIACYRPRAGCDAAVRELIAEHLPLLRSLGLATDRAPLVMRAGDGTYLEVFEWASIAAVQLAHHHPDVLALWGRFEGVCDHVTLRDLAEGTERFAAFEPVV